MYEGKESKEEQNFWVSYADLMAGLLFVFILVLGAIVIKYVYVQANLEVIKTDLQEKQSALEISNDSLINKNLALNESNDELSKKKEALDKSNSELDKKKEAYLKLDDKLKKAQNESVHLSFDLAKTQNLFNKTKENLKASKEINDKLNLNLKDSNSELLLSNNQIEKITKILNDKSDNIKLLDESLSKQSEILKNKVTSLEFSKNEITKLKDLLLGYELRQKEFISKNDELSAKITKDNNTISLQQGELAELTSLILVKSKEHQILVDEFDITKVKIKSLTGIRIKVITALKKKLGPSINIDQKSGAIKFSSNILFDQGQFELKEKSKSQLSSILKDYIRTLLLDNDIKQYIEDITIEGHTNSDGTYLYNLQLSQQRALEVMKFMYSLDFIDKKLLKKYINASGRSYADRIRDKNGFEEKDSSRRIEIKFRIKNEQSIRQLSNYLDK